ncbi:ROK family protein [Glaciibacter sp. 2TAF33]|uniref:ROK family protein n=1 Tax=Glaciibacter sp. 2TAF33 TaxID=3233015 RepID=UPI003F8F6E19
MTPPASPTPTIGSGAAVLAFDVGGTDTKAALFDGAGAVLGLSRTPTAHRGPDTATAVIARLGELASDLAGRFPLVVPLAAGLVVPGLVDDERGVAIQAANLDWADAPFRRLAADRLGLPVAFSHDVRGAGQAEYRLGAARPYQDVVVIVVGTGIASAIFLNGRAHVAGGYAGEIGHSVIDPAGLPCSCGARGCLETVASAGAITRRYQELTGIRPHGARDVRERAEAGDPAARGVWDGALDTLALGIAQLAAVLAPQAVVIGGGLAQAGDALFEPLRQRVEALLSFHRRPVLLPAEIGENAGLIGAALIARDLSPQPVASS